MSKYKGSNYGGGGGNSRANAAAAAASSSSSSSPSTIESLSSLVDLLDSYGFDLPAMLLLFWLLLFFLVVGGVNLYLALVRRRQQQQQKLADQKQKVNSASSDQRSPESEALLRSSVAANSCQSSPPPKRKPNYALEEDEEGRRWIAKVIDWLYNRGNLGAGGGEVSQSVEAWLTALNAKSAQLTAENGIHVEFVRLYREKSSSIHFTDVKVESEVNGNLLTTLKAICDRLVIAVRVHHSSRDLSATVGQHQHHQHQQHSSALYEIELNKFSALLKVVCKPEDSLFIVRCLERPETKVHINGPLTSSEQNSFSPDLIINGVINVLTSTLVDLSFANADRFPAFPARHTSSSTFSRRTFDGSAEIGNGSSVSGGRQRSLERKLFVTIARAHNLPVNQSKEGHEVYCTIEMNEPRERRQTSSIRGPDASAPVWQDHFLFALNEQSREIHFEVFDGFQERTGRTASASASSSSTADVSLGTGVANLLELKLNPSEKLTIPLQRGRSNGYQSSGGNGGGSLEVELLLMEHKLPNGGDSADEHQALNLPEKSEYSKMPAELAAYYRDLSSTANSTSSHLDQYARSSLNTIKSDDHAHSSEGYGTDRGVTPSDVPSSSGTLPPTRPESRSSQPPRERSLIRTIRKRLSFTKRSKSVERSGPGTGSFRESSVGAGSSSGLNGNGTGSSALDRDERARSVPGSREPSAPRDNMANGKKQESFLSLASNTSFFAENSTLVLECTVNGEKKHYIVPYSKANKRKYRRRKGVKLHVFNDHLFVAQHVSSSQECAVCAKTFPMRIGKQGYVCRECGFLTHKLCHVNVESYCPANGAARLNFEVEGGGVNGGDSDTPRQMPSPVPEVRVIAPTEPFNEKEVF